MQLIPNMYILYRMTENSIRRAERRAKAIDLLGGACARCDTVDMLEFDHTANDRVDKKHTLAWLLHGRWDLVLIELDKCQLLCRGCHAVKTQQEDLGNGEVVHGKLSGYMHFKCRCQDCRDVFAKYYRDRRRLHAASNSLY